MTHLSLLERIRQHPRYLPFVILFLAFSLRLLVFRAISDHPQRFLQTDSSGYQGLAVNLLEYHRFGSPDADGAWQPHVNRTPVYPAFLATVYALFGISPTIAALMQNLLSTLFVALTYRLGKIWGYANQLMTETLFSLLFLMGMIIWSRMLNTKRWQYGFLSGLSLGAGALVRPVLFYFGAVAGLLTWLLYPKEKNKQWLSFSASHCW